MVHVTSEIGRLRRVLVHEPGPEVDLMVPAMMEELLFDDILFGERAREEHRRFRRLLQLLGVEVVEAAELLTTALASSQARTWLGEILGGDADGALRELLDHAPADELAPALVHGLRRPESGHGLGVADLWRVAPAANWCFQRDPQIVVGGGVVHSAMATPARWREAMLARAIFAFHPDLAATPVLLDPLLPEPERRLFLGLHRPRLEGGDVLVLAPDVLAVGLSERTNQAAVDVLLRGLARRDGAPRWLLVVRLPHRRAYMHLDTVFTPVDRDAALAYLPVIAPGSGESADVLEADLHASTPELQPVGSLPEALARRGLDLELIPCGGTDPVAQQREQWTDGANALAVAPGVITLYDRNVRTAEALDARGFDLVEAEALLLGRAELSLDRAGRTCLLLASHEISRARGGPHCLTHPLERDDLA